MSRTAFLSDPSKAPQRDRTGGGRTNSETALTNSILCKAGSGPTTGLSAQQGAEQLTAADVVFLKMGEVLKRGCFRLTADELKWTSLDVADGGILELKIAVGDIASHRKSGSGLEIFLRKPAGADQAPRSYSFEFAEGGLAVLADPHKRRDTLQAFLSQAMKAITAGLHHPPFQVAVAAVEPATSPSDATSRPAPVL